MNGDVCLPDKSQIAREILMYLEQHPEAQDTLDGIMQRWFPDRRDKYTPTMVREVVKDLVLVGTILESKTSALHTVYRLNLDKRDKMQKMLKKMTRKY